MARFLGSIEAKTDSKGRVFLPATFRKVLQAESEDVLILRKDVHNRCLVLYPLSSWTRRTDAILNSIDLFDKEGQAIYRQFVSAAIEVSLDGNGRLLLPKEFLKVADIDQSVRFLGMDDTIEIWAAEHADEPFLDDADFAVKLEKLTKTKKVDANV